MTTFTGGALGISFNHLLFGAFLLVTALAGTWKINIKNFKTYAAADGQFSTGSLILTLWSTIVGGAVLFGVSGDVYAGGISGIVAHLLQLVGPILLVLYFIAPRIVHFQGCTTAGDLMGLFYGEPARILTGLLTFGYCIAICAFQFWAIQFIGQQLGINSRGALFLGSLLLALYTVRGGMSGVITTDILHFVVAFGTFPLLAHLLLYQAGGLHAVLSTLSPEKLQLFSPDALVMGKGTRTVTASIIASIFPSFALSLPFIQRMLIAKHQGQSTGMYRGIVAITVPFILLLGIIGLTGIPLALDSRAGVLIALIDSLPAAGKGVVWIAVLGIILSTADSFLHAAGIGLAHDTLRPLANRWNIRLDELKATRYSTLLISFLGFLLCLTFEKVPATAYYIPRFTSMLVVVPLMAGIMGLKTDKRAFYIAAVMTIPAYALPFMLMTGRLTEDVSTVGSILMSLFSYLGAHYYHNGGFVTINRSQYGQTTAVWHPSWQGAKTTLTSLIPTPQKVVRYFQQSINENSSNTTTLALFVAVSYMVPLFMHSVGNPEAYNWLLVLRIVGAMFCVGLLLQSQWPDSMLRFFPAFYYLTLLWCFPFMTTFLLFLDGGSMEWVMNVMLVVTLLILLLDYMTAVGLAIAGVALAMTVYRLGIGPLEVSMDRNLGYMLTYGTGFSVAIGMLFSRLREKFAKQANRRLVHQQAAVEAHFPEVVAENEKRTKAFQQIGIKSLLHTARKLHTIQHQAVAAQQEQQALLASLTQRQQALMNSFMQREISQDAFFAEQQELQAEFNALTRQQSSQATLLVEDQEQSPQAELQTLAQHHLTPQAELNSLAQQQQDLQADLLPLVMQLQDLDARGKDHLTLDVKKDLSLDQLLLSLQEKLLPRGIDVPLITERKTQQQKLTADGEQLVDLLVKGIASLQWLIKDQDQYLLLGIEDTCLSYPLPDVEEGYVKQVPALRIALTATEELPPLKANYTPDLSNFNTETQTFQEMEVQADTRLIKAHYGYTEMSEDTLIYVIPVDVYEVRPEDMDKPELAIGTLPERADDHFRHETADAQAQEEMFLKVIAERSNANLGMIKLALNLIKWYHGHKNRHSGEPFYLHPLAVAQIVMDYDQDEATIVGALLHDTVEDTPMLMGHIEALFGQETAEVVDLVTHLQSIPGSMYKIRLSSEENLRMLAHSVNTRGLYVKLADRMHNMRTINGHPKVSKRKLVARETMDFFVPLARKLGLKEVAAEFERMCEEVFKQQE